MIENIEHLTNLEELWLGKNKIEQINLPYLPKLKKLSVQHNRLTDICEKSIKNILCVEELYISYNKINHIIDTFKDLKHLKVFDLSYNEINNISICSYLKSLEELWLNNNNIDNLEMIDPTNSIHYYPFDTLHLFLHIHLSHLFVPFQVLLSSPFF